MKNLGFSKLDNAIIGRESTHQKLHQISYQPTIGRSVATGPESLGSHSSAHYGPEPQCRSMWHSLSASLSIKEVIKGQLKESFNDMQLDMLKG